MPRSLSTSYQWSAKHTLKPRIDERLGKGRNLDSSTLNHPAVCGQTVFGSQDTEFVAPVFRDGGNSLFHVCLHQTSIPLAASFKFCDKTLILKPFGPQVEITTTELSKIRI